MATDRFHTCCCEACICRKRKKYPRHLCATSSRNTETLRSGTQMETLLYTTRSRAVGPLGSRLFNSQPCKAAICMKDKDNRLPIHLAISRFLRKERKGNLLTSTPGSL